MTDLDRMIRIDTGQVTNHCGHLISVGETYQVVDFPDNRRPTCPVYDVIYEVPVLGFELDPITNMVYAVVENTVDQKENSTKHWVAIDFLIPTLPVASILRDKSGYLKHLLKKISS